MLIFPKLLARICTNSQGKRCIALTSFKVARFRGKELEGLKRAVDKNLEAKKIYGQHDAQLRPARHLWRAFAFFAGTGLATYSCASIFEYYNARKKLYSLINDTIAEFKRIYFGQPVKRGMDETIAVLIALNCVVFVLWRIPIIQPFMNRYFTTGFASKSLCLPMLLGTFSHNYLLHLLANMYVLHSFSTSTVGFLGKEQFLAFYLTGGVFSSLVSLLEKCATRSIIPSLGASGAIAAMIGYVCSMAPDAKISLIFLPQWTFSAENALYGMIAFEIGLIMVGLFTRFRFFDNAAHLGGLFFGMWYAAKGEEFYRRWFMPKAVNLWLMSGLAPSDRTPVIIYDGKRHVHTTMDKVNKGGQLEESEKQTEQMRRRQDWEQYRERQVQKQRERKRRILEERRRRSQQEEEEDGEEEEEDSHGGDEEEEVG